MDAFIQLFGNLLVFVYHCFDRIVIHGYLSALSRPAQVVHFFRQVVGVAAVDKEVLSRRTADYQNWVEAYAHNHGLPIEWAEKGVRKEDHVLPWLRRMTRANRYGVYFIFKSMEQGIRAAFAFGGACGRLLRHLHLRIGGVGAVGKQSQKSGFLPRESVRCVWAELRWR